MSIRDSIPRVRVAGYVQRDQSVLLVRHEKGDHSYWLLPGGGVEYGESLEEALVREFSEEVSLDVEIGPLLFVNDSIAPDGSRHMIQLAFRVDIDENAVVELGIDERVVEARFVPWEEIQQLVLRPDLRTEIGELIQNTDEANLNYLGRRWLE